MTMRKTFFLTFALLCSMPAWAADTTAPSVPTGLKATVISGSQIDLTWNASTDNTSVKGYRVYRNGTQVAAMTNPAYSNTGLASGTTYTFAVAAYDAAGNASAQTAPVSAKTLGPLSTFVPSSGTIMMTLPPCQPPFELGPVTVYKDTATNPLGTIGSVCIYIVP